MWLLMRFLSLETFPDIHGLFRGLVSDISVCITHP